MSVFKCKICGGSLEIDKNQTTALCEYCGTEQTLPRLDDDKKINLYDRANHFRRDNEFDKAMAIYEQILENDNTDAEAYWSIVLCHYGIEYVEEPTLNKRVPTINRVQYTSIFDDDNYKSALKYADFSQKIIYESEAEQINNIQKGILQISQNEEPFDIFICYKETDKNGRRTPDSVLANDLYHQLTQEGFRVFFSRITLEDKLGSAYEPYIFAALNSSKVMIVLGTKPEYFQAVWVKNEWSRYLALVKKSAGKKVLIPAYRDMDPYGLPEEFSHLQAQDMAKLGFMQDLIRGVKKILGVEEPKQSKTDASDNMTSTDITPLLKRTFIYIEDGEWEKASNYCERILDIDPENAETYLAKLLIEKKLRTREELGTYEKGFTESGNYKKVIRFGNDAVKAEMEGYVNGIEQYKLDKRYNAVVSEFEKIDSVAIDSRKSKLEQLADSFKEFNGYKDSEQLVQKCLEMASEMGALIEENQRNEKYENAKKLLATERAASIHEAIGIFASLSGYKDSDELKEKCSKKIADIELDNKYHIAKKLMNSKTILAYQDAIGIFKELGDYKDSAELILTCKYNIAMNHMNTKTNTAYEDAITVFKELGGYKDSAELIQKCKDGINDNKYYSALKVMQGDTPEALKKASEMFAEIGDYKDSVELSEKCISRIDIIKEENEKKAENKIKKRKKLKRIAIISAVSVVVLIILIVVIIFSVKASNYNKGIAAFENKEYSEARDYFSDAIGYKDSDDWRSYSRGMIMFADAYEDYEEYGFSTDSINENIGGGFRNAALSFVECIYHDFKDSEDYYYFSCGMYALSEKDYEEAIDCFEKTQGFLNSEEMLNEAIKQKEGKSVDSQINKIRNASEGAIVEFGKYKWVVIKKNSQQVLLQTKDSVANMQYHEEYIPITWENCSLRKWLNEDFYNTFDEDEKEYIYNTTIYNDNRYADSITIGGNDTSDRVFLLSRHDTIYKKQDSCWLRTPGENNQSYAMYVYGSGYLDKIGDEVTAEHGVCPAIFVNISK